MGDPKVVSDKTSVERDLKVEGCFLLTSYIERSNVVKILNLPVFLLVLSNNFKCNDRRGVVGGDSKMKSSRPHPGLLHVKIV